MAGKRRPKAPWAPGRADVPFARADLGIEIPGSERLRFPLPGGRVVVRLSPLSRFGLGNSG